MHVHYAVCTCVHARAHMYIHLYMYARSQGCIASFCTVCFCTDTVVQCSLLLGVKTVCSSTSWLVVLLHWFSVLFHRVNCLLLFRQSSVAFLATDVLLPSRYIYRFPALIRLSLIVLVTFGRDPYSSIESLPPYSEVYSFSLFGWCLRPGRT